MECCHIWLSYFLCRLQNNFYYSDCLYLIFRHYRGAFNGHKVSLQQLDAPGKYLIFQSFMASNKLHLALKVQFFENIFLLNLLSLNSGSLFVGLFWQNAYSFQFTFDSISKWKSSVINKGQKGQDLDFAIYWVVWLHWQECSNLSFSTETMQIHTKNCCWVPTEDYSGKCSVFHCHVIMGRPRAQIKG